MVRTGDRRGISGGKGGMTGFVKMKRWHAGNAGMLGGLGVFVDVNLDEHHVFVFRLFRESHKDGTDVFA
jgi:hypothetical protein